MNARLKVKILAATKPRWAELDARLQAMADGRNALREAAGCADRGALPRPSLVEWFRRAADQLATAHEDELASMEWREMRDIVLFGAGVISATAIIAGLGLLARWV